MKTLDELKAWCEGAERRLGDPAAACGHAFFRFAPGAALLRTQDLTFRFDGLQLLLRVSQRTLPISVSIAPSVVMKGGAIEAFGMDKIAPGLWALNPSLNIPGRLHVFVVLYGLPSLAPWESR